MTLQHVTVELLPEEYAQLLTIAERAGFLTAEGFLGRVVAQLVAAKYEGTVTLHPTRQEEGAMHVQVELGPRKLLAGPKDRIVLKFRSQAGPLFLHDAYTEEAE